MYPQHPILPSPPYTAYTKQYSVVCFNPNTESGFTFTASSRLFPTFAEAKSHLEKIIRKNKEQIPKSTILPLSETGKTLLIRKEEPRGRPEFSIPTPLREFWIELVQLETSASATEGSKFVTKDTKWWDNMNKCEVLVENMVTGAERYFKVKDHELEWKDPWNKESAWVNTGWKVPASQREVRGAKREAERDEEERREELRRYKEEQERMRLENKKKGIFVRLR